MKALLLLLAAGCAQTYMAAPCTIACSADELCPDQMACGDDDFCHAAGETVDCSADAASSPGGGTDARGPLSDARTTAADGPSSPADGGAPPTPDAFVPTPDAACGYLGPGEPLERNERATSCNGQFFLIMQGDDNLVFYQEDGEPDLPLWSADTVDSGADRAIMQHDGNLVVYRPCGPCTGNDAVWASGTEGNPGAYLAVGNDGRLTIYSSGGAQLWTVP